MPKVAANLDRTANDKFAAPVEVLAHLDTHNRQHRGPGLPPGH